jgi:hypothetical protein
MLHCSFQVSYFARSSMLRYSVQVCYISPSRCDTLLGPSMLHCSVRVCFTAQTNTLPWRSESGSNLLPCCFISKGTTCLSQSMIYSYCSVQVCYTARSKYVTLLGSSKLHCPVQVCYTARSKYATLFRVCYAAQTNILIWSSESGSNLLP